MASGCCEPGGLLLGCEGGPKMRRNIPERRALVDFAIGVDERHRWHDVDRDRCRERRIHEEPGRVAAETIVLPPRLSICHPLGWWDVGRKVIDPLDAFDGRPDSTGVEQVEFPGPWCGDFHAGRLEERQECAT